MEIFKDTYCDSCGEATDLLLDGRTYCLECLAIEYISTRNALRELKGKYNELREKLNKEDICVKPYC